MKQDRFLTGILIGIGVLIVVALALFFLRREPRAYIADTTPDGVVHNYVLALLNKDYQKAYDYLADLDGKPSYDEFRRAVFNGAISVQDAGIEVGSADVNGDEATVKLTMYYSSNDPFSGGYQSSDVALLVKQKGAWKIRSMPYSMWDYSWYSTVTP